MRETTPPKAKGRKSVSLAERGDFAYSGSMEVHFTTEQEAQLAQIATSAGTDTERLVKDAALRLLQSDVGYRAVLSGGVVAAMRALRARVKPDPEGWTTRDYVLFGRR